MFNVAPAAVTREILTHGLRDAAAATRPAQLDDSFPASGDRRILE